MGLGQATTPLESLLNPDGTLDLQSGFSGSLDARGWQMVSRLVCTFPLCAQQYKLGYKPEHRHRKLRQSGRCCLGGTISGRFSSTSNVPGDENWDGTFGIPNVTNAVHAVAVSSNGDAYIRWPIHHSRWVNC